MLKNLIPLNPLLLLKRVGKSAYGGLFKLFMRALLRIYIVLALITAAISSNLLMSFAPLLLLFWYLYIWLWPVSPLTRLFTYYFMFFALAILFNPLIGPFLSLMVSFPVVIRIDWALKENAGALAYQKTKYSRLPTRVGIVLPLIGFSVFVLSLLLGNRALLLASSAISIYFIVLATIVIRKMPLKPVEEKLVEFRMVAGSEEDLQINLSGRAKIGGVLYLASTYDWVKVKPGMLPLKPDSFVIKMTLSPKLSGPYKIGINGFAIDHRGLIQVSFYLKPIALYVVPRARYAEWLAKRYLEETGPGAILLSSNILSAGPIYGMRRGVEYYGNRPYQPGDNLKNISWKSSFKHHELISKEFTEFHGQSIIALINLAVSDEEEADKMAYWIISTAITLAQENIPTILAAYDHEEVRVVTPVLQSRQLVVRSLEIAREMVTFINPVKYLNPPNVARLRADIHRLSLVKSPASRKVADLLELEYKNLDSDAKDNPATKALLTALNKGDRQSNILIISHFNHDSTALSFNTASYRRKGNAIISPYSGNEEKYKRPFFPVIPAKAGIHPDLSGLLPQK